MEVEGKTRMILDINGSNTDFINLILLLQNTKIELIGITTSGDVASQFQTSWTTKKILKAFGGTAKVVKSREENASFRGRSKAIEVGLLPLVAAVDIAEDGASIAGQGDSGLRPAPGRSEESAGEFIAREALSSETRVAILATGDLGNLEFALSRPGVAEKLGPIVLMGERGGLGSSAMVLAANAAEILRTSADLAERLARLGAEPVMDFVGQVLALSRRQVDASSSSVEGLSRAVDPPLRELCGAAFFSDPKLFEAKMERFGPGDAEEGMVFRPKQAEAENILLKVIAALKRAEILKEEEKEGGKEEEDKKEEVKEAEKGGEKIGDKKGEKKGKKGLKKKKKKEKTGEEKNEKGQEMNEDEDEENQRHDHQDNENHLEHEDDVLAKQDEKDQSFLSRPLHFEQCGSTSGLVSLLLMYGPEGCSPLSLGVSQGDNYLYDGEAITLRTLSILGLKGVDVGRGALPPRCEFSYDQRQIPTTLLEFPMLRRAVGDNAKVAAKSAHHFLISMIEKEKRGVRVLAAGPATGVARAMAIRPDLAMRVDVVMLADERRKLKNEQEPKVDQKGRPELIDEVDLSPKDPKLDNFGPSVQSSLQPQPVLLNHPRRFTSVFHSLTIFPPETLRLLEISNEFLLSLSSQRHFQASNLALQAYAASAGGQAPLHLKDEALAVFMAKPELFELKEIEIDTDLEGLAEGDLREVPGSGNRVKLVSVPQPKKVLQFVLDSLRYDFPVAE